VPTVWPGAEGNKINSLGGNGIHRIGAILSAAQMPVLVPVALVRPDGTRLTPTSMTGQLVSVNDAPVEGLESELMVPADEATEARMLAKVTK